MKAKYLSSVDLATRPPAPPNTGLLVDGNDQGVKLEAVTLSQWSIAFWVYVDSTQISTSVPRLLDIWDTGGVEFTAGLGIAVHTNNLVYLNVSWINTGYTIPRDQDIFLAFVHDGTNLKIYADGVEIHSAVVSFPLTKPIAFLGTLSTDMARFMAGRMDDMRIYSRAITEAEVISLMTRRNLSAVPSHLIGWYRLEERSPGEVSEADDTIIDSSGAGNHGAVIGTPEYVTAGAAIFPNLVFQDTFQRAGHLDASIPTKGVAPWGPSDPATSLSTILGLDGYTTAGRAIRLQGVLQTTANAIREQEYTAEIVEDVQWYSPFWVHLELITDRHDSDPSGVESYVYIAKVASAVITEFFEVSIRRPIGNPGYVEFVVQYLKDSVIEFHQSLPLVLPAVDGDPVLVPVDIFFFGSGSNALVYLDGKLNADVPTPTFVGGRTHIAIAQKPRGTYPLDQPASSHNLIEVYQ